MAIPLISESQIDNRSHYEKNSKLIKARTIIAVVASYALLNFCIIYF